MSVRLGCGDYRVAVLTRGDLTRPVVEVPWNTIEWGRVLDETSEATVTAGGGCCDALLAAAVRPWSHQLAIYRGADGAVPRRVWSGPLVALRDGDALTFVARDLSAWFDRRRVHTDQIHVAADLATIFEAIWDDALDPDPIEGFTLDIAPAGVDGDREVLADQYRMAGDELRELGRTGLDWTVIDRVHHVGPEEIDTPPIASLIDEHLAEPPEATIDGAGQANDWVVTGSGGGAEGAEVFGTASATPGPEGLLEAVASEPAILDDTSALAAADNRLARSAAPLRFVRDLQLLDTAPVPIDRLVPGARVRVALENRCIPVRAVLRLTGVRVSVRPTDRGVQETVTLDVEPLGAVAS